MIIDRNAVTQEVPIDPETGKPYLNTVAAIQVSANGVGSEVSPYVAQAVEVIRESGLPQETTPCSPTWKAIWTTCSRWPVRPQEARRAGLPHFSGAEHGYPPRLHRPADRKAQAGG